MTHVPHRGSERPSPAAPRAESWREGSVARIRRSLRALVLAFAFGGCAMWLAGCPSAGGAPDRPAGLPEANASATASTAASAEPGATTSRAPEAGVVAAPAPRRDLAADERRGGHTLDRHVARSDEDLRQRLRAENISAASTYTDRETAERVVYAALQRSKDRVAAWTARRGARPNLALQYRGTRDRPIGRTMFRGTRDPVATVDAVVVLRWDVRRGDFFVLTSYPEGRR